MRAHRLTALLALLLLPALASAGPLWIDVRSPEEYQQDHIAGDPTLPYADIGTSIATVAPDRNAEIVLYCAVGGRAFVAKRTLESMGYTNVRNAGGIAEARKERGCNTVELAAACTPETAR
jgi:phage shock protein E